MEATIGTKEVGKGRQRSDPAFSLPLMLIREVFRHGRRGGGGGGYWW